MGSIEVFDIEQLKKDYNLTNYIESGTGEGITLSYALKFNFNKNISIEIFDEIFNQATEKFKSENCEIVKGNSYEVLPDILSKVEGNSLFFLDAHFPGADFGFNTYNSEKDINKRLPLEKELTVILDSYKNYDKSVIIVDDLRIYEDGPFEDGNWSDRKTIGLNGINFIYELFDKTHNIEKNYKHQGYVVLKPKNK